MYVKTYCLTLNKIILSVLQVDGIWWNCLPNYTDLCRRPRCIFCKVLVCVVFDVLQKMLWSFYFSSNTFKFNINYDVPNIPLQTFPENLNTLPLYLKASTIHNNTQVLVNFMSMLCQFLQYISIYNVFLSLCFYLVTNVHNSICLLFVTIIVTFSFFFSSLVLCVNIFYIFTWILPHVPNAPMLIQTTQFLIQNSCYWLK